MTDSSSTPTGIAPAPYERTSTTQQDAAAFKDFLTADGDTGTVRKPPAQTRATESSAEPTVDDLDDTGTAESETDESQSGTDTPSDEPEGSQKTQNEDEYDEDFPEDLRTRKIKIADGKAVTYEELRKGYLRQQDYTVKTQEAAALRQQAESHAQALAQQRQQVDQVLTTAMQFQASQMPKEPDWAALAADPDPRNMIMARAAWDQHVLKLGQLETARQANARAAEIEAHQNYTATMNSEYEQLTQKVSEFKDPKKRAEAKERMVNYAAEVGFTPAELANLGKAKGDHRLLMVLDEAARYRALVKKAKARPQGSPPANGVPVQPTMRPVVPGQPPARQPSRRETETTAALKNHGKQQSLRSAARAFATLLD